ncbi:hypothetical protein HELRODRAFT_166801 [Helobdella robusta]|uniref:Uncharacterized protein n=1 Tax=Helobdella robusta TaxID=6412 RepID=T1EYJ6_HELRO|nr:hypothetical protein HELRODRAFT_166801 [Helobdella robusta]ESO11764.1 hypothetical protein HELRODRAFT_166801 [Helobdella robusta]
MSVNTVLTIGRCLSREYFITDSDDVAQALPRVKSISDLGVVMDDRLHFKEHVLSQIKKSNSIYAAGLMSTQWVISSDCELDWPEKIAGNIFSRIEFLAHGMHYKEKYKLFWNGQKTAKKGVVRERSQDVIENDSDESYEEVDNETEIMLKMDAQLHSIK